MLNRTKLRTLALGVLSSVAALLLVEAGMRLVIQPSDLSSGTFLGRDLPPVRIARDTAVPEYDPDAAAGSVVVDGVSLTKGDLYGIIRPDPLLGYTHQESALSANGWWRSNNVGARAQADVERAVPEGKVRVLVFGDSFARGSRVRQEHAWPNIIHDRYPGLEVLNFGVDGYSMGQSLLRYQAIRQLLDYDVVVLLFVPHADLWREINVIRDLGERGWDAPYVLPRFVLERGEIRLVPPLYEDPFDVFRHDGDVISPRLHEHLLRYDRYYYPPRHRVPPVLGASIFYKLAVEARWLQISRRLRKQEMDPNGEAVQISRRIFSAKHRQVASDGAAFILTILPLLDRVRRPGDVRQWQDLVTAVCSDGMACIDLHENLRHLPVDEIDYGEDGSHYGPKMNEHIAVVVAAAVQRALAGAAPTGPHREALICAPNRVVSSLRHHHLGGTVAKRSTHLVGNPLIRVAIRAPGT